MAGCSPLAPKPDYSKFFILTPISDAPGTTPPAGPTDTMVIGVGPVDFPDYLKGPEVVTRAAPNRLDVSTVDRGPPPPLQLAPQIPAEQMRKVADRCAL